MPEWLLETGIGEDRALLVEGGQVLAAKLRWPGDLVAGSTTRARLASKAAGAQRGTAVDEEGREILIDRIPAAASEGSIVSIEITRAAIDERGRYKRAQGRVISPDIVAEVQPRSMSECACVRRFPAGLWEEVWSAAFEGELDFAGGSLLLSVTPAMTVIDIDGTLPARELAMAAVPAIARALRWFDLGGSIGIDFPTLATKADRKAVDEALDRALDGWDHERTAMNGFGFVQIVARLEGPSLLHRMENTRIGAAARMVLRRAELLDGAGAIELTVHPAIEAGLKPAWIEELARRTGRKVRIEADRAIAIGAGHAQIVQR